METLLDIKDLRVGYKTYRGVLKVLNGVYLTVKQGEKVGLIGESGCGKTTTMKSILRILPTNAILEGGEIFFKGKDILKMNRQLNDVIKYSGILENEKEKVTKEELKARAIKLLKEVALPDPERVLDSYPFQLSGGMRQRICIAMSLATARDLLIADEPTTNLDVTIQDQVLRLMKNLVERRNLSVILISHALGAVRGFVDRVYVMYAGNMVEAAETKELFSNPLHPYTQGLLASVPKLTGTEFSEGIKGRIPDYLNPPTGCRFHPRCDYVSEKCKKETPLFIKVGKNHEVACWRYQKKVSPHGKK